MRRGRADTPTLASAARRGDTGGVAERRERAAKRRLEVAGLFAGIGGLELGLGRAGHHARLLCELDASARAVLEAHLPEVPLHDDVRTLDRLPRGTTLLAAGFPCQDLSQAGKTAGIAGARSGLVGEIFRLLERDRAPWVLLENVPFMLQLARGQAMGVVVEAIERLGYKWAYRVIDSRAFGLPQRRERVYFLASLEEDPRPILFEGDAAADADSSSPSWDLACGFYWTEGIRGLGWAVDAVPTLKGGSTLGIPSPPAIVLPGGEVVTPDLRDAERLQGFEADWTKPAERAGRKGQRWKLVGNAVTTQVAAWIGERLARPPLQTSAIDGAPLAPGRPWPKAAWNLGEGRSSAKLSTWPVRADRRHLHEFLEYPPRPLSAKATRGFLGRTDVSALRFPPGLLDRLRAHLTLMERAERAA